MNMIIRKVDPKDLDTDKGGYIGTTAEDSEFFRDLGLIKRSYTKSELIRNWTINSGIVDRAWTKVGILCVNAPAGSVRYFYKGSQITRKNALLIAMKRIGKFVDIEQYRH